MYERCDRPGTDRGPAVLRWPGHEPIRLNLVTCDEHDQYVRGFASDRISMGS